MKASLGKFDRETKRKTTLFVLRFFCYLSVALLAIPHPGIPVSYDRTGFIRWFVIIPLEALIAFLPAPGGKTLYKPALAVLPLAALSIYAGGFGPDAWSSFCAGLLSFSLTLLLFRYPLWGKPAVLEPFFLAWVCFQLLAFSRSGEEASGQSMALTQIILVWTVLVFLLHSVVVYFCLYPQGISGVKREAAIFGLGAAAALVPVVFLLPADFVRNGIVINLLQDRIEKKTKPDDNDWGIPQNGGGRDTGRRTIPGDDHGRQPGLRGLSEYDWPGENGRGQGGRGRNGREDGGETNQQYTVMVVASKQEPVYLGNSFRGSLDPVQGFLPTPDDPLNRLPSMRLFTTWFDNKPVFDRGRVRQEVFSLSTLPQKYLPYRPFAVEPTVLSEGSGPFRYIHRVVSNMYVEDPLELVFFRIRDLNAGEQNTLAPYLEFPLEEEDRAVFSAYLSRVLDRWRDTEPAILPPGKSAGEYLGKIFAILLGFEEYRYNISDNEDSSIAALIEFLLTTKDGDCVQFSNTAALLGRLAGIPSRVVTGYLAANSLQTLAHLRGLAALRSKIPVLQEFPFEDLYLVTDAHSHSWVQFYIPDYGWLDFEATAFAVPPAGFGNGNLRDVVIPLIDETRVLSPVRSFPWRAVLRAAGILTAAALLGAYGIRYGREILLRFAVRRGGRAGARSLYLLLLAQLAADGKPIKPASKTAAEYARSFPGSGANTAFAAFAALYAELRWREFKNSRERDECFRRLMQEYRNILAATTRRGVRGFVIRLFSLRGLTYL
ncbi:MAG: transglutaminase domain-containing protein [Treponema sp.]|jgi:hypothetical protein|nr:transglutaminase domain-containing protein [Treponema sp.]